MNVHSSVASPVAANEIQAGLVLHLDPDTLEQRGGSYTCEKHHRVKEPHFFLCVERSAGAGTWVPLYSNGRQGRVAIATQHRAGHAKWINGNFFYDKRQVWTATDEAVQEAAIAGNDQSTPGNRNTLDRQFVPPIQVRPPGVKSPAGG